MLIVFILKNLINLENKTEFMLIELLEYFQN